MYPITIRRSRVIYWGRRRSITVLVFETAGVPIRMISRAAVVRNEACGG